MCQEHLFTLGLFCGLKAKHVQQSDYNASGSPIQRILPACFKPRSAHVAQTIKEYSIRLKSQPIALTQLQQLSNSELAAIVDAASKPVKEDERQKDFKERAAYF